MAIAQDFALEAEYDSKFVAIMEAKGYLCFKIPGRFSFFDFLCVCKNTGAVLRCELKTDRLAHKTGNLAIEVSRDSDTPTGINATKADLWVYNVLTPEGYTQYWVSPKKLKPLITGARIVNGGDGWRTQMALLPITEVEPLCKAVFKF
jgi:hypothetical protein